MLVLRVATLSALIGSGLSDCNADDHQGQRQIWVPDCHGVGCFANGVNHECAWCVYDLERCELRYGGSCAETLAARAAQGAECPVPDPYVVVPGLGSLEGATVQEGRVHQFLSIPYALPPVKDRRWQPPVLHGPWSSPRVAKEFSKMCRGANTSAPSSEMSEDCLYLNIFRPSDHNLTQLPVMVFIHGGAFLTGSASFYPADALVDTADQPVIVVTLNYRINVFGFLASKELQQRSLSGSTGNMGIEDQRLALSWVQMHIDAFGGAKERVTIFGQSAGGASVIQHLVQPQSFGLFQAAIIESGTYRPSYSVEDGQILYDSLLEHAMCTEVECLANKSADEIEAAIAQVLVDPRLFFTELHWGPVIDGVALFAPPHEMIANGQFQTSVPVIIGSNRDEWAPFAMLNVSKSAAEGAHNFWPTEMDPSQLDILLKGSMFFNVSGPDVASDFERLYAPETYEYPANLGPFSQSWWTAMRIGTDAGMAPFFGYPRGVALGHCSARHIAKELQSGAPAVFMYDFAHPRDGIIVGHGDELSFVFGKPLFHQPAFTRGEAHLSVRLINYWVAFASSGDPNHMGATHWPKFTSSDKLMRFEVAGSIVNVTVQGGFRAAACDLIDSFDVEDGNGAQLVV